MHRPVHVLLGVFAATLLTGAPAFAADAPTVDTSDNVTAVTTTSATVSGTVNPNGSPITDCHFNYGTFFDYGQTAPCSVNPGGGNDTVTVTGALTGLPAGTTIHYQLEATNAEGTSRSFDSAFDTAKLPAPAVTAGAAVNVASDRATLTGVVNPNGLSTDCTFEYGRDAVNSFREPCAPSPGSGTAPVTVSALVTGLLSNQQYHFRIVTQNSSGETTSQELTFTTSPPPPPTGGPSPAEIFHPKSTTVSLPSSAKVRSGKVAIKVACTGDFSCNGPLTLSAKLKSHGKATTVGHVVVSLSAKTSHTYSITLSSAARAALKRQRSLKVTANLEGMSRTITLKR
jgi:hypothetical protein